MSKWQVVPRWHVPSPNDGQLPKPAHSGDCGYLFDAFVAMMAKPDAA